MGGARGARWQGSDQAVSRPVSDAAAAARDGPSIARRVLDRVYELSGCLAGLCLVAIAVLVLAQIVGRLLGILVPSADDFAGYAMGASVFLALAHTLRAGGHIRVSLIIDRLGPRARR